MDRRRRARWVWSVVVALMLPPLCAAQTGAKKVAPDPCQSRDRCLRLYQLGKAPSVTALEKAFHAGCDGYSEEAVRALRRYQLGAPGGAHALLNSMPRGIGDFMSLLWMTGDGTRETEGDFRFIYGTDYPKDGLPTDGCRGGSPAGAKDLFRAYYSDLARVSASHPKYLPGFFAASQLFGYKADWDEYNEGGSSTLLDVDLIMSRLLASLLRTRPTEFTRAAHASKFGYPALRQAEAALAAERRKTTPAKPGKGSHGAR